MQQLLQGMPMQHFYAIRRLVGFLVLTTCFLAWPSFFQLLQKLYRVRSFNDLVDFFVNDLVDAIIRIVMFTVRFYVTLLFVIPYRSIFILINEFKAVHWPKIDILKIF